MQRKEVTLQDSYNCDTQKIKMFSFNSIWRQFTIISGVLWNLRPLVLNKIYLTQTHKTVYFIKTVHAKSFHNYIWTGI